MSPDEATTLRRLAGDSACLVARIIDARNQAGGDTDMWLRLDEARKTAEDLELMLSDAAEDAEYTTTGD